MLLIVDGQESPWPEALIFVRSNAEIEALLSAEGANTLGSDADGPTSSLSPRSQAM